MGEPRRNSGRYRWYEDAEATDPTTVSRRDRQDLEIAENWKLYLAGGLCAFVVGLTGTAIRFVDTVSSAGEPSRDELIELLAADSSNTYDRVEAECVISVMDEAGLDLAEIVTLPRDDFTKELANAMLDMSVSEFERIDACLDDESRSHSESTMSDDELRELLIQVLVADTTAGIDQAMAECFVDRLQERSLLRELVAARGDATVELDAALLEAEVACS